MKSTVLYTGQKIKIPQIIDPNIKVLPVNGTEIIDTANVVKIEPTIVKPKPKPVPVKKYYVVKAGDTGSKVSQKHNLTQQQLVKLNPGLNIDRISVGQQIRVK